MLEPEMRELSDAELVDLARSGDRAAFGSLVERHEAMARRVAGGVVQRADIAAELASEAVLQAYLSLDRLRDPARFQSWLHGIVLNVCKGYLRSRDAQVLSLEAVTGGLRVEVAELTGLEPDPQEVAEARELHEVVLAAVAALSPRNRAATLLFYYEQLTVREIAATLGVSVAAVKGRLHQSRGRLRELLAPVAQGDMPDQEEGNMIEVTIADILESKGIRDEEADRTYPMNVVMLLDKQGRRVLPIWIGATEALAIAMALRPVEMPRPMTYGFTARLLEAADTRLEEVRIHELRGDTFYAVARLRSGDAVREVDARPSDAMALAVVAGSPIFVAQEVIDKAGDDIPDDVSELEPLGKGIDGMVTASREEKEYWQRRTEQSPEERAERIQAARGVARQRITGLFVSDDPDENP